MTLPDHIYQYLFDNAPFGLALCTMSAPDGSGGEMVKVNQAFADIIGRTIKDTIDQLKISYWNITPDDYEEHELRQIEAIRETGRYGPYIKEYFHKKGHTVPVQLWGGLVDFEGVEYIWSSVFKVDNPYQLAVFDDAPYALALTCFETDDPEYELGDLVFVNKEFARMVGYTVEEVLRDKKSYWALTPDTKEYRQKEAEQIEKLNAEKCYGVPLPYRKHYKHKDGEFVGVRLHGRVTEIRGRKFVWSIIEEGDKKVVDLPSQTIPQPKSVSLVDDVQAARVRKAISQRTDLT